VAAPVRAGGGELQTQVRGGEDGRRKRIELGGRWIMGWERVCHVRVRMSCFADRLSMCCVMIFGRLVAYFA
jgi:hypothetical protein